MKRRYYSQRNGINTEGEDLSLEMLSKLFMNVYERFAGDGYFQEYFGYYCVDEDEVPGKLGGNIEAEIIIALRKTNIWPISSSIESYKEDDLFDVIEFLYDHISKPVDGWHHTWNDCGWHFDTFDKESGQIKFRERINLLLADYGGGYELSSTGELLAKPEMGLGTLLSAKMPESAPIEIRGRIESAILKFRRYKSSQSDRRDALRDLADVLEYLRPQIKEVLLPKDESDLFEIANSFGIRHYNDKQKTQYDQKIWFSWIFYYYLTTINAVLHLLKRQKLK